MMFGKSKIRTVRDVAEYQLCTGCGACAYMDPEHIRMVDDYRFGRRPLVNENAENPIHDPAALAVCPGINPTSSDDRGGQRTSGWTDAWGQALEFWEGYAADAEIRFAGSSGGAASALALFCIERLGFHGVLHVAARTNAPYLNQTVFSGARIEILEATGSRYSPASPCDGLRMIEDAPGPCVFIGKPCDVAAVRNACRLRSALARKLGLTIAIFCAGTPTTRATLALLARMGVGDPARVIGLRYRGSGWPGRCIATGLDHDQVVRERDLSYEEAWGQLSRDKQWRCHVCPDHTGELADIAVGDPWYRAREVGEAGRSLIMIRTPIGQRALLAAILAGYLVAERTEPWTLERSQRNLLKIRGAVWGRLRALRGFGIPVPRFRDSPLFRVWARELTCREKLQSIFGTIRRIRKRQLRRRHPVTPSDTLGHESSTESRCTEALARV